MLHCQQFDPRGRQFDGEGDPIQGLTNPDNRGHIPGAYFKTRFGSCSVFDKQARGFRS